jgi:hypothetical protein
LQFYKVYGILSDIVNVEGLTIREIAEILNIPPGTAKTRLFNRGVKPKIKAGKTNLYDNSAIDLIKEVSKGGRPKKSK